MAGNALTVLAQQRAQAVYDMRKYAPMGDMPRFFHGSRRGVGG
jgi:hypothetical protein